MLQLDRDDVLAAFRAHGGRPLKAKDVSNFLSAPVQSRSEVRAFLRVLAHEGDLALLGGGRYVLAAAEKETFEGNVRLSRKGYGWFSPTAPDMPDAFVPPPETHLLMDGDTVEAKIEPAPKGNVARIVRVISRSRNIVVGRFIQPPGAKFGEVDVGASVMRKRVIIDQSAQLPKSDDGSEHPASDTEVHYRDGDVVEVQMLRYPTNLRAPMGRIIRRIGRAGQLDVEIERLLEEHQIVRGFSREAIEQAEGYGDAPSDDDKIERDDLRKIALCTIDGQTAKDFDDAVYGECKGALESAPINIIVTIADVAHYVKERTPLDEDARERGTSLYYPSRVVPMLPEALSNGLCSLKPHVDRLCMSVKFTVDKNGALSKPSFSNAVMHSHARITYEAAWNFLSTGSLNTGVGDNISEPVQRSLHVLYEASKRLRAARNQRGALDFDLPEPVFDTDEKGHPEKVVQHERNDAHRLIEELMIAANETVASHFFARQLPSVFRVHEPPDPEKLERFMTLAKMAAKEHGVKSAKGDRPSAKSLSAMTAAFKGSPLKQALDSLLLRAMMQAKYSAENVGHFSLASDAYLHFTSPIRRYPDLAVHRELKRFLANKSKRKNRSDEEHFMALDRVSGEMSDLERKAMDCERAIMALYAVWYLRGFIGERFDAVITGVTDQGAYVRLLPTGLDAFLPIARISKDYLVRDDIRMRLTGERSGFSIGAGDKVSITLTDVDFDARQAYCDLEAITEQSGKEVHIIPSKRDEVGYFDKRFGKPGQRKREYFKYGNKDEGDEGESRRHRKGSGGSRSPKKGNARKQSSSSNKRSSGKGKTSSGKPSGRSKAKPSKRRKPKNKR